MLVRPFVESVVKNNIDIIYVHCPLKAWDRYSPTMFKTHMLLSQIGKAPEGPWHGIEQVPKMIGDKIPPKSEYLQPIETLLRRLKDHTCWSPANCEALRMELIKTLISERSEYFERARKYFSLEDIEKIHGRLVGSGRIGGKAAGMLLAKKILDLAADSDMPELKEILQDHDSYHIGSDTFFQFLLDNDLLYLLSQQYKELEQIVRIIKIEKEKGCFQAAMDRMRDSAVCFVLHKDPQTAR